MGFNPMEKMKAAAVNKLEEAKFSVKNKAEELKDSALEKGKEASKLAGQKAVEGAKAGFNAVKEEFKDKEPEHITTAADYTGDLNSPVTVLLTDDYDEEYDGYDEDDFDDDSSNQKVPAYKCCSECNTPFAETEQKFHAFVDSFDKNHPCRKDKSFGDAFFCSVECGRKFLNKKYPGAFVTDSEDEFNARLMAGRKASGTETFADKIASKAAAKNQLIQERKQAMQEQKNSDGLLVKLFPILRLFKK